MIIGDVFQRKIISIENIVEVAAAIELLDYERCGDRMLRLENTRSELRFH